MISWKAYWCCGTSVAVGVTTALMALLGVPLTVGAAVLAVGAFLFLLVARRIVHAADIFDKASWDQQREILRWLAVAAIVHVAWGAVFLIRPDLWVVWILALTGITVLEYWMARGHEWMLTRATTATARNSTASPVSPAVDNLPIRQFEAALILCKRDYLNILTWDPVHSGKDGHDVGVRYEVRLPPRIATTTKAKKDTTVTAKLDSSDVEPIAIAMSHTLGKVLNSDWVTVTKLPGAGMYSIVVLTEDVMSEVYEFVDTVEWTDIDTACLVGYELDGCPHYLRLNQHGADTGASRMGKSSLVNVKFAHTTRARKTVQWVSGVVKLYDLLADWIEPYRGTGEKIPFNWVMYGPEHLTIMLLTAFFIARWRQNQPMDKRGDFVTIMAEVDEASFALTDPRARIKYEGVVYTASHLVKMIEFGAGSEHVWVHLAGQRATDPNWGDYSTDINSGLMWQTVFRSRDEGEIGRATGDYTLPMPTHKGEYWLNPGPDDDIVKLKAPYIQESNPGRPRLHGGATIQDVAWARRFFGQELDEGSARIAAQVAGALWTNRHRHATDQLVAYLTGNDALPTAGESEVVGEDVRAETMDAIQDIMDAAPWHATPAEVVEPQVPLAERIVGLVRDADRPMTPSEIMTGIRDSGMVATDQVVTNALTALVRDGSLIRPERGLYKLP